MPFHPFSSSIALATTIAFLYTSGCYPVQAIPGRNSIDLIHRDSLRSPFYNSSLTSFQRLAHALKRSFNSAKRFNNLHGSLFQTEIIPDHGEFLANISFGTPPHQVLVVADTGSDLSWIQCKPCTECYKQKGSLFNPKHSSTYKPVPCDSTTCKAVGQVTMNCSSSKTCEFHEGYADGSYSNGNVSTETVTLGTEMLQNVVFGCGFSNGGIFRKTWGGIAGLGRGELSLVSQLSSSVPRKFSYCLIPFPMTSELSSLSSKLTFGGMEFGPKAVSTPFSTKSSKTFYHLTLEGVSVGDIRLDFDDSTISSTSSDEGNIIIDSGTTLTFLPPELYKKFELTIRGAVRLRILSDPQKILKLCYRGSKVMSVPRVVMHFKGANVTLSKDNLFVSVSKHIDCLAFAPAEGIPIYGNVAQMNFLIGYDLENKAVSFEPIDCTKL